MFNQISFYSIKPNSILFHSFPSISQRDTPFHCIAYDCFCADCDGLRDHLRDVLWEDIFKVGASAAATELCEYVQVGIAAATVHRNYFFHLYQKDRSSDSKVKFRQASNRCKRVLEGSKLAYAYKTKKIHYFPETWLL